MSGPRRFSGRGLHTGELCAIELSRTERAVAFEHGGRWLTRSELELVGCQRGVRVAHRASGFELELVEHLFAALGGLSIQRGIGIAVSGPEVPLLGGGALELARALVELSAPADQSELVVVQAAVVEHGASRYRFEPGSEVSLRVDVDFPETGVESAGWDGDRDAFLAQIAPARTFGFLREAAELSRAGRARHVDPNAVLVLDADGRAQGAATPRQEGELARHKLLDLIGDCYLHGGPPRGRISAIRPGHAATHAVLRRGLEQGILQRHA